MRMTTETTSPLVDYPHDNYLKAILLAYGLQLSPTGMRVVSTRHPPVVSTSVLLEPEEPNENIKREDISSPSPKRKKIDVLTFKDEASRTSTDEMKEEKMSSPSLPVDKKTKAYQLPPMEDPELERKRRNAIIAWKNRVRRKREAEKVQERLETVEEVNNRMVGVVQRVKDDVKIYKEQLRKNERLISRLMEDKQTLETKNQAQQEKLMMLREHIILINGSLEEGNSARRLLDTLLERLDATFPAHFTSPSNVTLSLGVATPRVVTPSPQNIPQPRDTSSPNVTSPCVTPPRFTSATPPLVTSPSFHTSPPNTTSSPGNTVPPPLIAFVQTHNLPVTVQQIPKSY